MHKKTRSYMLCVRDSAQNKRYTQTKTKGMEKDISCKCKGKKRWVAILTPDKIECF